MKRFQQTRAALLCGAAMALAVAATPAMAQSQVATIDIQSQPMSSALKELARQSGVNLLFSQDAVKGLNAPAVQTEATPEDAARMLLAGTNLSVARDSTGALIVQRAAAPQSGSAAGDGAEVEALIVTAQKREEDIQDVPIAISAFTQEALEQQKIEGGFDLLKAIPNVTFSKNNFTSYNFSIRGIGTKAVSATSDPGVAVAFNSSGLIFNRLFEQEYFDIERVEVLRGPQGTLYGRNATAGVINVISAKPDLDEFKGWVKGEVGNYHTKRISAMVNVPLLHDKLGIRIAGALTDRDGYGYNAVTDSPVDGRDLWSGRVTVGFEPTENFRGNLVWERFREDDDRARTSKQLCHRDEGPESILDVDNIRFQARALLSQGCKPGSLYDQAAFNAPNGDSLPYIFSIKLASNVPTIPATSDPYGDIVQSQDLREISSRFDPQYQAEADLYEMNLEYDLTPSLTLVSQTLYNTDSVFSTQDYNRFNTQPIFSTLPNACMGLCIGGYLQDPQLGASDTLVVQDISKGKAQQFSQEFRIQSDFDGPLNFNLGANYVRAKTIIDYYVFSNAFRLIIPLIAGFTYIDENPLDQLAGDGHNYYRSQNPYKLTSKSAFGEVYWNLTESLKLTGGLRYTDDRKKFDVWPTQLLNASTVEGGTLYKQAGTIDQHWGEVTGRLGIDWKPELSFTDSTMLYAVYSRGYKAGGANPPNMGPTSNNRGSFQDIPVNAIHPATFDPEFVNAFEVGAKNVLLGGSLVFNTTGFYYDYKGYQVSQIIDRMALNDNYDAKVWGLEFETVWSPSRNLQVIANLGYLDTKIADGEESIDVMNRTYGHSDEWIVLKNWIQFPSNCIVPKQYAADMIKFSREHYAEIGWDDPYEYDNSLFFAYFDSPCLGLSSPTHEGGFYGNGAWQFTGIAYDPYEDTPINRATHNGAGFSTPLGGNELPNAPHWTTNIGVQYGFDFLEGWRGTVRADAYWQSQSWARVYNLDPYDKLHGWYNANLSVWVENDDGLKIELYAKNILDDDPITDAFLNSDDSGLTTNVFVLDPRLIGLSIRKEF